MHTYHIFPIKTINIISHIYSIQIKTVHYLPKRNSTNFKFQPIIIDLINTLSLIVHILIPIKPKNNRISNFNLTSYTAWTLKKLKTLITEITDLSCWRRTISRVGSLPFQSDKQFFAEFALPSTPSFLARNERKFSSSAPNITSGAEIGDSELYIKSPTSTTKI